MKKYSLFLFLVVLLLCMIRIEKAHATVGGPTFIYDFKYNPADESIYYVQMSESGRGCPPELIKMSLSTGKTSVVFSCEDGEKLSSASLVESEISKITKDFELLRIINLRENNIEIDVIFSNSENYSPELNELLLRNFDASVYQNDKKITDFKISGCQMEQPFVFAGYAIPGFDKKIILLSSAIDNCNEGGYVYESLHIIDTIDVLKKKYWSNTYKTSSALAPDEGNLVIYEADKIKNNIDESESNFSKDKPYTDMHKSSTIIMIAVSFLVGFLLGALLVKFFTKNEPKF